MIKIMNLRTVSMSKPYDVLIDRRTRLGNPIPMTNETERDAVCDKHHEYFHATLYHRRQPEFEAELDRILNLYKKYKQLRLFCWCAPKRCHGETIKAWLESRID